MKANVILLVDVDGDSVGFVLEAAARTGHGVRVARSGHDAAEVLESGLRQIDAVIIDVDASADGLPLIAQMTRCNEGLPLVVLCGERAHMKTNAPRSGAATCVYKPLSIDRLRSTLDRILIEARHNTLMDRHTEVLAAGPEPLDSECATANCESASWDWHSPSTLHAVQSQQFTFISHKHENDV